MTGIKIDGTQNKVVLDDDADTYFEAATDDTIKVYVAGAQDFTITANTLTAESGSTIAAQALTATTIGATGVVTANAGVAIDNITIDGTEIDLSSGDLTLDVAGRIDLSADDNGEIRLYDGSSQYAQFKDDSDRLKIQGIIADKDILFAVNNGGSEITNMQMHSIGAITKPLQPCVLAYSSSAQNDIAAGVVTIQLDAEVYDVNADFNTSNYTFTAPVTGKYMCSGQIAMTDVDTAFQWIYGRFNSSNRIYYMALIDPRIEISADGIHTWTFSALVDMDANDTLVLDTRSSAHGAAQNNITVSTATSLETFMTVYLAA